MSQAALDLFINTLPDRPYVADDFKAGLRYVERPRALQFANIQLHGVRRVWLPFDLDYEGAAFAWEAAGLPPPTIITVNPMNAYAHGLYGLENPVTFLDRHGNGRARRGPMNFYRLVQAAYRDRLRADPAYPGFMTKNPLYKGWHTIIHDRTYTLEELAGYVDLRGIKLFERANVALNMETIGIVPEGYRNDTIFHAARQAAYGQVKLCNSRDDLFNVVMSHCASINAYCRPPLANRQLTTIARSISKWCWDRRARFSGDRTNRGVCGFQPMPPAMEANARKAELEKRRRAGAAYTASVKRAEAERRIAEAREQLQAEGKRITKAAVSKITGLSERALRKDYSPLFGTSENRNLAVC